MVARDVDAAFLAVSAGGRVYFTDPRGKRVWLVEPAGARRIVRDGLESPRGIVLSPDQGMLAVTEGESRWVWSFQVGADGSLANGQPFYRLETPDESSASGAEGMAVDVEGFLYVATRLGLQVMDQPGRLNAIIDTPLPSSLSSVVFAGPDLDTLYVTTGDRVFRRHVRRRGVRVGQPLKPPQPRL